MRIAFAMINCNRRDGSARAVNEVAEILARRGHEVHLYARKAEDLDLGLVRWHRVPGPGWPEVADFSTYHHIVNRLLAGTRYDIVHSVGCNTLRANVVTIQNIQPVKMQVLARVGSAERVSAPRRLTRWLYLRATCRAEKALYTARPGRIPPVFLPVSRGVAQELRSAYDIGAAEVRIVPNAADTAVFHPIPAADREVWRRSNGLPAGAPVAIFSGGEWGRKGLDTAIRALAFAPQAWLYVAGDDPDRARYRAIAAEAGVSGRVVFGGFRSDIATAMASCDVFFFPSRYEAFSLATIEAAACGLPVLATKINGTEDFILPGTNGEFCGSVPGEAGPLLRSLLENRAACEEMGRRARELVEARYTWDRVASLTEEAYQLVP